jgi:hypothetical protein
VLPGQGAAPQPAAETKATEQPAPAAGQPAADGTTPAQEGLLDYLLGGGS